MLDFSFAIQSLMWCLTCNLFSMNVVLALLSNYKEFQRLIISLLTMRAHSSQTLSQGNKVSQWLAVRRGKAGVGWYRQG